MSTIMFANMQKVQSFIPYNQWPISLRTNCLAYALGLPIDDPDGNLFGNPLEEQPVEKLVWLFDALGFDYRWLLNEQELEEDEYGIVLYHYFYPQKVNRFGCRYTEMREEFHLARIELDGSWTEKAGWVEQPTVTSPEKICKRILMEDHVKVNPIAYFAVRKP